MTLAFLSFRQCLLYRNSTALWLDTLAKNKDCCWPWIIWAPKPNSGAIRLTRFNARPLAFHASDQREAHLALGRIFAKRSEWESARSNFQSP